MLRQAQDAPVRTRRGVSCDRCGDPYPRQELILQDGYLRCRHCLRSHGKEELDAINASDPPREPLTSIFGGERTTRTGRLKRP